MSLAGQTPSRGDPGGGETTSGGKSHHQSYLRSFVMSHSCTLDIKQNNQVNFQVVTMNIKDSLKFGVMIGLLEVHKVPFIYMRNDNMQAMKKVMLIMVVGTMLAHDHDHDYENDIDDDENGNVDYVGSMALMMVMMRGRWQFSCSWK